MRTFALAFECPPEDPAVRQQIDALLIAAARDPKEGSYFDRETRDIRDYDDEALLKALIERGYDAVVVLENGRFTGCFSAFQKHVVEGALEWHGFFHFVPEKLQGQKIGRELIKQFMSFAHASGAVFAFVWAGDELRALLPEDRAKMEHFYHRLVTNQLGLPFLVERGTKQGQVRLLRA